MAVSEDVYKAARVHAAHEGRSVSALVAEFLTSLASRDNEFKRLEELQRQVMSEIVDFSAEDRLTREQVHERAVR